VNNLEMFYERRSKMLLVYGMSFEVVREMSYYLKNEVEKYYIFWICETFLSKNYKELNFEILPKKKRTQL